MLALKDREAEPARRGTKAERRALRQAEKGQGKGKGKGKGSRSGKDAGCSSEIPDGKRICYAFNNKDRPCTLRKCNFLHVCGKCFQDHPMWSPQCNA
jgi:hypothetical protein